MSASSDTIHAKSAVTADTKSVLFITRKWGPAVGGMETYCERLTQELAKSHSVDIIALKGRKNGQPPSTLALLLFPFTVLTRLINRRKKPAIIHLGDMAIWPLGLLALAFYPRAKLIISAHGTDVSFGARGGFLGALYSAYQKLGARLLGRARTIANSSATRQALLRAGWNCENVVPLATDLQGSHSGEFDKSQILFAGRIIRLKGLSWFIENVLPLLPEEIRLSVIGTRWDASECKALNHARVDYLGHKSQAELARHFAKAACVVLPNIELETGEFEGFGLIAPEAASAGGVVLASASGGLKDAVIDEETGFLLRAGNAQIWANKILEISAWDADKRAGFISTSKEKARSNFNWARVARDTSKIYLS